MSGFALYSSFEHFRLAQSAESGGGGGTMVLFLSLENVPGAGVSGLAQREGCVWAVMHRKGLPGAQHG